MATPLSTIISRNLKTSRKNKETFLFVLEAMLTHLKPSILFDLCSTTPSHLNQIIQTSGHGELIKVVKLLDDIILVDTTHEFVGSYCPVIIDCSIHLGMPRFLDEAVAEQYSGIFKEMMETILTGESPVVLDSLCRDVCLTTIFGMFLQFPYVYYTSDHGNCLAGVELIVVELGLPNQPFTSFSLPRSLGPDEQGFSEIPHYLSHRTVTLVSVAM